MSKAKAAGILGALTVCGLLVLVTLAVAAGDPADSRYFAMLQSIFLSACLEQAVRGDLGTVPEDDLRASLSARAAFFEACAFIVRTLKPLTPAQLQQLNATRPDDEVRDAALDAAKKTVLHKHMTCDACVQAVRDLERTLFLNTTASDIEDALAEGCERRFFFSPAKADQCLDFTLPPIPDLTHAAVRSLPPTGVCEELRFCPLPPP